jgi:hypothetical protein
VAIPVSKKCQSSVDILISHLGESVLTLLGETVRSENMGECQEGVDGGGDLPRLNQAYMAG